MLPDPLYAIKPYEMNKEVMNVQTGKTLSARFDDIVHLQEIPLIIYLAEHLA
jgi:hypothetical protein